MGEQISQPNVTLNILGASLPVANADQKVLIVGPMLAAGTATALELNENVAIGDINTLFGLNSMLAEMCRAFKAINNVSQLDVIALADAAGTEATGDFVLAAGPATVAGTLYFTVGSYTNRRYTVPVAINDTITDVGDALDILIAADTEAPFNSVNGAGTIAITMENDGTFGNFVGLRIEGSVAGITHSVTAMSTGAGDPVITNLFDAIAGVRYQTIVYPSTWAYATLKTLMDARWNATNKVMDGLGILTAQGTSAALVAIYELLNDQQHLTIGNKTVAQTSFKGGSLLEFNDIISCQIAAIRALRLTPDQSISHLTVAGTNGARDSFGGDAIRSLPYFNTPFSLLPIIPMGTGFTDAEITALNNAGVSVLGNNIPRNSIIADAFYTLYKTDAAGNPDSSFEFLNYVDTMSGIREYFFNNYKSRFAQSRLTEGELVPRRNMANKAVIEGYSAKLYGDLAGEDYVLVQEGDTSLTFFKDNLSVILDTENRKVTVTGKVLIVTQLGTIIGSLQLSFTT